MVFDWIAFSGFIALAFFSDDMQKFGTFGFFDDTQGFYQLIDIMTINRSEIQKSEFFK